MSMNAMNTWNPSIDEEILNRLASQLKTYYPTVYPEIEASLQKLRGQPISEAYVWVHHYRISHGVTVPISATVYKRLHLADQAIKFAKDCLPFGAGNQFEAWTATCGNTRARKDQGKGIAKFGQTEGAIVSTGSVALVAYATQGATCRGYASLVYHYLLKILNVPAKDLTIWSMDKVDHVLIILGDPESTTGETVAIDAWPTDAQAILWKDHFAYGSTLKQGTLQRGSAQPLKVPPDLAEKLIETNDSFTASLFTFASCCASSLGQITYTIDGKDCSLPGHREDYPRPKNLEEEKKYLASVDWKNGLFS